MTPRNDIIRDERGAALIYVVLFMLSSLWFVSLAIDMGKLTVTKGELQRAADAAALAPGPRFSELKTPPSGSRRSR